MDRKPKYQLPGQIGRYVKHLSVIHQGKKDAESVLLRTVIENSAIKVQEGTSYDNWDGGITGHSLSFLVPGMVIQQIGSIDTQNKIATRLAEELNKCSTVQAEHIDTAFIELLDDGLDNGAELIRPFGHNYQAADTSIWDPGYLRLFISHRDKHKGGVAELAGYLKRCGISCFVAHDSIAPMTKWHEEIERALFTMDALLIFLTDDFSESLWTDQEVGVALGRGVPVIPLRLEKLNPYGLVSKLQAIKGTLLDLEASAKLVFEQIANSMPKADKVRAGIIEAFANATSYTDAIFAINELLPRLKKCSDDEIERIVMGFNSNDQLHGCYVVTRDLPKFLKNQSNRSFLLKGAKLVREAITDPNEIPF